MHPKGRKARPEVHHPGKSTHYFQKSRHLGLANAVVTFFCLGGAVNEARKWAQKYSSQCQHKPSLCFARWTIQTEIPPLEHISHWVEGVTGGTPAKAAAGHPTSHSRPFGSAPRRPARHLGGASHGTAGPPVGGAPAAAEAPAVASHLEAPKPLGLNPQRGGHPDTTFCEILGSDFIIKINNKNYHAKKLTEFFQVIEIVSKKDFQF